MSNENEIVDLSDNERKIAIKRIKTILELWDKASRFSYFANNGDAIYHLNQKLLGAVITHYICDLRALKMRYRIAGKVQFPKIAGLMTNAIAKYKPLIPRRGDNDLQKTLKANEVFAVFYGLCVLFDADVLPDRDIKVSLGKSVREFISSPSGKKWKKNMYYLLNRRTYTAESLIAVFETLCIVLAPDLLENGGES